MSWVISGWSRQNRIVWEDEDGEGMTLGGNLSPREPELVAITQALLDIKTERDARGFYWNTRKAAQQALKLVKAVDKPFKDGVKAVCPCCKRLLKTKVK